MNKCQSCGCPREEVDRECPECGNFHLTIAALIAEEEANEEQSSFSGQCKRILTSGNVKQALLVEIELFRAGLTKKGLFTIFLIMAFVFALLMSVL